MRILPSVFNQGLTANKQLKPTRQESSQPLLQFGSIDTDAYGEMSELNQLRPTEQYLFKAAHSLAVQAGDEYVQLPHLVLAFVQTSKLYLEHALQGQALGGSDGERINTIVESLTPEVYGSPQQVLQVLEKLYEHGAILINDIIQPKQNQVIKPEQTDFDLTLSNMMTVLSDSPELDIHNIVNVMLSNQGTEAITNKDKEALDVFKSVVDVLENPPPLANQAVFINTGANGSSQAQQTQQLLSQVMGVAPYIHSCIYNGLQNAGMANKQQAGVEHLVAGLFNIAAFIATNDELFTATPDELQPSQRAAYAVLRALMPADKTDSLNRQTLLNILAETKKELDEIIYTDGQNMEADSAKQLNNDVQMLVSLFLAKHEDNLKPSAFIEFLKEQKTVSAEFLTEPTLKALQLIEDLETRLEEANNNPSEFVSDVPETAEDFEALLEERKSYYDETDAGKKNYNRIQSFINQFASMDPNGQEAPKYKERLQAIFRMPTEKSEDNLDLAHAEDILNNGLYGLDEVKEEIYELIAALKTQQENNKDGSAAVIALLGPPGIGKTAISKFIAKAMNREFAEIHLGGVSDANALSGHGFTYHGSGPGMLSKALMDAGTTNPVILMDEVGRLTDGGLNGDPSGPLINITDPTKDYSTKDDFMDISFSYKDAVVILTANDMSRLPAALKDRILTIDLNGYSDNEKAAIGKQFLLQEALDELGFTEDHIQLTDDALNALVEEYTFEPGVRSLKKLINKIVRKLNLKEQRSEKADRNVSAADLVELLGEPEVEFNKIKEKPLVGYVNGLATMGNVVGAMFPLVVAKSTFEQADPSAPPILKWAPGTPGKTHGDMTHDSLNNVLSFIKSDRFRPKLKALGFEFEQGKVIEAGFQTADSNSMDGPSAGAAITTALISELTGRQVRQDVAMTGTIVNNIGEVGKVGGIPLKVSAARKGSAKVTFIPKDCEKDYDKDFTDSMKEQMPKISYEEFKAKDYPVAEEGKMWVIPVDDIEDILEYSLLEPKKTQEEARETGTNQESLPGGVKQTPPMAAISPAVLKGFQNRSAEPAFSGLHLVPETALGSRLNQVS